MVGNQGLVLLSQVRKDRTYCFSPLFHAVAPAIGPQSITVIAFVPLLCM